MAFFPNRLDVPAASQLPSGVEQLRIQTRDGQQLQCYWIPQSDSRQTLIYFHGNGGNISQRISNLLHLSTLNLNVLGVGYRGYGSSTGTPSEAGIYLDGQAALRFVTQEKGFDLAQVYLLGRSIGSTVAVEIAQRKTLAGVILVAPLTTAKDFAKANGFGMFSVLASSAFNNSAKIKQLRAPLLIVHGTLDDVIPFELGRALFHQAPHPKQFTAIEGAGHNNISTLTADRYWQAINRWVQARKHFSFCNDSPI